MSGILHTDSSKFTTASSYNEGGESYNHLFNQDVINADLQDALKIARANELAFYSVYFSGVTGYRDFIAKVRALFEEAGKDWELIKGLSNANLKRFVPRDRTDLGKELDVQIIINSESEAIDLKKLNLSTYGIQIDCNPDQFHINLTRENVAAFSKDLVYIVQGAFAPNGMFFKQKQNEMKIQSTMKVFDTVVAWLDRQATDRLEQLGIKVDISEKESKITNKDKIKQKIQPFTLYTKNEIRERTGDPEFEKEFAKAFAKVKAFMLDPLLKGSEILQEAAKKAWGSLVGDVKSELREYFFEGENLDKSILGYGGEFQLQIIHNYLAIASKEYNGSLGEAVGGIGSGKRKEPRSDFQIMEMLGADIGGFLAGIQVKNVSEGTGTRIHTKSDLELIAPGMPEGFRDTLANVMFNTDIASQVPDIEATLKAYVEAYFWRAMNLHVGEGLNPNHTNTFYMYRGTSLIPASEIIMDMLDTESTTRKPKFEVSGLVKPDKGDEFYAERVGDDRRPNWLDYFDSITYLGFGEGAVVDADTYNYSEYNRLLAQVSVNSTFSLSGVAASLIRKGGPIELFPH